MKNFIIIISICLCLGLASLFMGREIGHKESRIDADAVVSVSKLTIVKMNYACGGSQYVNEFKFDVNTLTGDFGTVTVTCRDGTEISLIDE